MDFDGLGLQIRLTSGVILLLLNGKVLENGGSTGLRPRVSPLCYKRYLNFICFWSSGGGGEGPLPASSGWSSRRPLVITSGVQPLPASSG